MKPAGIFAIEKTEVSDSAKHLFRNAKDLVRLLEKSNKNSSNYEDMFKPNVISLRSRMREICEQLIFLDPVIYGKKAEDFLWRKVYYEVISMAKNNKKIKSGSESYWFSVGHHIRLGFGNYHHLMFRLLTEFNLKVEGTSDFMPSYSVHNTLREQFLIGKSLSHSEGINEKQECAIQIYHHCLVCLGDLARYQQEIMGKCSEDLAIRYYHQALAVLPVYGMPHNQLGTILVNQNFGCDAAYHYMRCLLSSNSFEGAQGNLRRVFEKNQQVLTECRREIDRNVLHDKYKKLLVKNFICSFMYYCDVCLKYPNISSSMPVEDLCQEVLQNLQACLEFDDFISNSNVDLEDDVASCELSGSLLYHIFAMSLMCCEKLERIGSSTASAATAFTLSLYSDLLHYCLLFGRHNLDLDMNEGTSNSLSKILSQELNSTKKPKKLRNKDEMRRSKTKVKHNGKRHIPKYKINSIDDSDLSEGQASEAEGEDENRNSEVSDEDTGDSSLSEPENDLSNMKKNKVEKKAKELNEPENMSNGEHKINEEDLTFNKVNNFHNSTYGQPITQTLAKHVLDQLGDLLPAIKAGSDWLKTQPAIITACAQGSQMLWSRLACLLNLLSTLQTLAYDNPDNSALISDSVRSKMLDWTNKEWQQMWPLPEDVALRGLQSFNKAHSNLNFGSEYLRKLSNIDEITLRIAALKNFGLNVSNMVCTPLQYDESSQSFVNEKLSKVKPKNSTTSAEPVKQQHDATHHRKQLMQNMAQLWLQAEVQELESSVKSSGKKANFPPYLVLDTPVLSDQLPLLKELLAAKLFVCIVPIVVIQSLDKMKKTSASAREAIRWLEIELQRGNRYIRAQKPQESLTVALLKYPKRKEKEAWNAFHVLECCNYIGHQGGASSELCATLVTLLTSTTNEQTVNLIVLGRSTGLSVEKIEEFHAKWKSSLIKSPG